MDPSIATIVGVLLGGLLSLAGVLLQASRQLHVERQKWQQARHEQWEQATRAAVIDLSMKLAAGVQLAVWLTWYAQESPHEVTEARLAQYEREMKTLQVELVGARVALASLNDALHDRLTPLLDEFYALDSQLAQAIPVFQTSPEAGLARLAACFAAAAQLELILVERISGLMEVAQTNA